MKVDERGAPVKVDDRGAPVKVDERGAPVKVVVRGAPVKVVERGAPVKVDEIEAPVKVDEREGATQLSLTTTPLKLTQPAIKAQHGSVHARRLDLQTVANYPEYVNCPRKRSEVS